MSWVNILDKKEKNIIVGEDVFVMFYSGYIRDVEVAVYCGGNKFFIRHSGQDISDLVIYWMKIENPLLSEMKLVNDLLEKVYKEIK